MSIVTAFVIAVLGPIAAFVGSYLIQDATARNRKQRAFKRVTGETLWFEGTELVGLWREGVAEPFLGPSKITGLDVGRIEITENYTGRVAVFTNEEFEKMYQIMGDE